MTEQIINIDRMEQAVALFGTFDENIRLIQNEYMVSIGCRGSELKVTGEPENVYNATKVIESLLALVNRGEALSDQNVRYCMYMYYLKGKAYKAENNGTEKILHCH